MMKGGKNSQGKSRHIIPFGASRFDKPDTSLPSFTGVAVEAALRWLSDDGVEHQPQEATRV